MRFTTAFLIGVVLYAPPALAHDTGHGNNVLLEPSKTGEIVWAFAKKTELEFGCNVPATTKLA